MFNWKVEDMALTEELRSFCIRPRDLQYHIFQAESETSREDKIAFVDQFNDGKLSYLLSLIDQFNKDVVNMPRDMWDNPKSVSLIAWIKRNDKKYSRPMLDFEYRYGKFYLCGLERYIQNANTKGGYDMYEDIVDECFRRQLKECLSKERQYFKTHDEYEVAKTAIREKYERYGTTFGMHLSFCSDGTVSVVNREDHFKGPKITLDQCKTLLNAYKKLEDYIATLSAEIYNIEE